MALSSIQFAEFDVKDMDDINARWVRWVSKLERYFTHKGEVNDAKKINDLFLFGGYDLEMVYDQYKAVGDDYSGIKTKLEAHFNPKANTQLNRYNFHNLSQHEQESFDEYVI